MNRAFLNGCFILASLIAALGLILILPSPGQAETIAQVKEIQGRAQTYAPPYSLLQQGDWLQLDALIYVEPGSSLIIQCKNGQIRHLPPRASKVAEYCGSRQPVSPPKHRMPTSQNEDATPPRRSPAKKCPADAQSSQCRPNAVSFPYAVPSGERNSPR